MAGVASSTDGSCDDEAAVQNAEHTAMGALGSLESIADIHTSAERAVEEAVRTSFFRAGHVSEEKLRRLVNLIEACDRWVDKAAACAWLPPSVRNLLDQCQPSATLMGMFSRVLF